MARTKSLVVGFEGLPGCGKTTVIGLLLDTLRAMGIAVVSVDIDTSIHAPALRAVADTLPLDNLVRSMLFWAMRIQQYEIIQDMRERMQIILMDRTRGTTLAYDGYGNGVSRELLDMIGHNLSAPDITFLLCVPMKVAYARKKSRTMEDIAFARRVEQGYAELADAYGWIRVDATQTPEKVADACFIVIYSALKCATKQQRAE